MKSWRVSVTITTNRHWPNRSIDRPSGSRHFPTFCYSFNGSILPPPPPSSELPQLTNYVLLHATQAFVINRWSFAVFGSDIICYFVALEVAKLWKHFVFIKVIMSLERANCYVNDFWLTSFCHDFCTNYLFIVPLPSITVFKQQFPKNVIEMSIWWAHFSLISYSYLKRSIDMTKLWWHLYTGDTIFSELQCNVLRTYFQFTNQLFAYFLSFPDDPLPNSCFLILIAL